MTSVHIAPKSLTVPSTAWKSEVMTSYENCSHARTKAARAACRKSPRSQSVVGFFTLQEAHVMNDMWNTLNTSQEPLLSVYRVVHTKCEYCDTDSPCFVFPHLGLNVCGRCDRMHEVHKFEES